MPPALAGLERRIGLQLLGLPVPVVGLLGEAAQFEAVAGRAEDARRLAQRAIGVYPTSPQGYAVMGRVLRIVGDTVGARAVLVDGLRRADPLSPIWTELERLRPAR